MNLTVGGVKGGIGKTTTAFFVAAAAARKWALSGAGVDPAMVAAIDADPQSQSLFDWYSLAVTERGEAMPYRVYPWSTPDLPRHVRTLLQGGTVHVVKDTGGENEAMLRAALHDGGELLIPCRPNLIELRRIPATLKVAAEVQATTGHPIYPHILLVCVNPSANDERTAREFLTAQGMPVMEASVRQSVLYPRTFGHSPALDDLGDYPAVLDELAALVTA